MRLAIFCVLLVVVAGGVGRQAYAAPPSQEKAPILEKELSFDLGGGVELELVLIPAGEFLMGSPDADSSAAGDEKPQHRVRITKPFYLGKYVVTQEQWQAVMGVNPSYFKGPKRPVDTVTWDDCQEFLAKLGEGFAKGKGRFALPTEAQWEYACRAGSTTRYCFGDDEGSLGAYAWYCGNSGGSTHPVGQKKPNAWGLYDMHGNVWEWCQDWYYEGFYVRWPTSDPTGGGAGPRRASRGGGWYSRAEHCRAAYRADFLSGLRLGYLGFRASFVPVDK